MSDSTTLVSTEGFADFKVGSETFKTWYKVFGKISSSSPTPLIMLHGGPGIPSPYLEPFSDLTTAHNIPVIIYDQIGCGKSTHLPNKGADFWTLEFFMDELENLLKHLGIFNNFSIGGHSWGGIVAASYAGSRQPKGLKHLILESALARMHDWVESNVQLSKQLPKEVLDTIMKHEKAGTTEGNEEYQNALNQFMGTFVCRMMPPPDGMLESLKGMNEDRHVSDIMYGRAWLQCVGTLKDLDITKWLPNIQVPTLLSTGLHDQAQDFVVEPFFNLIPKIRWVRWHDGSHMVHYELREDFMKLVGKFLVNK